MEEKVEKEKGKMSKSWEKNTQGDKGRDKIRENMEEYITERVEMTKEGMEIKKWKRNTEK